MASNDECDQLITAVQLFRHGIRNPVKFYKNIITNKGAYDGEEVGMLRKEGKQLIYKLGQSTRLKYKNLLGPKYSSHYYKISSSGTERTLQSAQIFGAGLYPPTPSEIWNEDLNWNPIPVYEEPTTVLAKYPYDHVVPKYRSDVIAEGTKIFESRVKATGLLDYVSKNVGESITNSLAMGMVIDFVSTSDDLGFELAEWVKKIYPEPMTDFYKRSLRQWSDTTFKNQMYVGGLLHEIIDHMETKSTNRSSRPNLVTYFAHDSNLVGVLQSLKVTDFKWPSTGGNLTFELWKKSDEFVVKITYASSKDLFFEPVVISLKGERTECTLERFKEALKENAISKDDMWNLKHKI